MNTNEDLRARRAQKLKSLRVALGNARLLTGEEIAAFDYAIAALARQEEGREAVAEVKKGAFGIHYIACADPNKLPAGTKLYTHPTPQSGEAAKLRIAGWQVVDDVATARRLFVTRPDAEAYAATLPSPRIDTLWYGMERAADPSANATPAPASPQGVSGLLAEWDEYARDLRKDGCYTCCAGTYEHCTAGLRAALTAAGAAPEGDLLALQQFAVDILGDEEIGSLDGGDIQDTAEACGLLIQTEATEACGEACICAGYGDFPMTCYRRSPILRRAYKADDDRRKAATPNPGAQHGEDGRECPDCGADEHDGHCEITP